MITGFALKSPREVIVESPIYQYRLPKHVFLFPDLNLYLLVPGDEVDLPVPGLVEHPLLVAPLLASGGDHGAVVAHLTTLVLPVVTVTEVTVTVMTVTVVTVTVMTVTVMTVTVVTVTPRDSCPPCSDSQGSKKGETVRKHDLVRAKLSDKRHLLCNVNF